MNDSKDEISKEMLTAKSQDSLYELCNDLRKRRTAMDALVHIHQEEQRLTFDDVLEVQRRHRSSYSAKNHSYRGSYHSIRHEEKSGSWEAELWDPRLDGDIRDGTHQLTRPEGDEKSLQRKRWSQLSGDESKLSSQVIDSALCGEMNTKESPSSHSEHRRNLSDTSSRRSSSGPRHRSLSRSRRRDATYIQMGDMILLGDGTCKSDYDPGDFNFRKNTATSLTTITDGKVVATPSQRQRHHRGRPQTHSLSRSRGGRVDEQRVAMLREQRDDAFARLEEILGLQPVEARDASIRDSVVGLPQIDSLHRRPFHSIKHEKEERKWGDILTKDDVLEPEVDCDVQKLVVQKESSHHRSVLSSSVQEPLSIKNVGRNPPEETKTEEKISSHPQQSRDALPSRSRSLRGYRSLVPVSPREHGESSVQDENQGTSHGRAGKNDHKSGQENGKGTLRDTSGKKHDNSEQQDDMGTSQGRSVENEQDSECMGDKARGKATSITKHISVGAQRQLNTGRGSQTRSVSRSRVGKTDLCETRLEHQILPGRHRSLSRSRRSRGPSARSSIREPEPEVKEVPPRPSQTKSPSESEANIVDVENQGTFRIVAYRAPPPLDGTRSEFVDCGVRSLQHPVTHIDQARRSIRPTEDLSGVKTNVPCGNSDNKEIRQNESKHERKNEKLKALRGFFSSKNLKGKNKGAGEKRVQSDGAVNVTVDEQDKNGAKMSLKDQTRMVMVPESILESESVLNNTNVADMKATSRPVVIHAKQRIKDAARIMSTERTRLPTSLPIPKGMRKSSSDLSCPPPGDLALVDSNSPAANENSQDVEHEGTVPIKNENDRTPAMSSPLDFESVLGMWVANLLDALCGPSTEVDADDERDDVDSLGDDIDYYEYSAARRRLDGFR